VTEELDFGGRERVPLRNQAQAVLILVQAAQDALDAAKVAAENMDAEQAAAHMAAIRKPARTLMALRQGAKEAVAQWTALMDQLPSVITIGKIGDDAPPAPRWEGPNLCKACGGSRRTWSSTLERQVVCSRCGGTGKEPTTTSS